MSLVTYLQFKDICTIADCCAVGALRVGGGSIVVVSRTRNLSTTSTCIINSSIIIISMLVD